MNGPTVAHPGAWNGTLRQRLSAVRPGEQDALLVRYEAAASNEELIDLLARPPEPSGTFVVPRLLSILTARGPAALESIAAAMRSKPRDRTARRLAGVLADIAARHPGAAPRIVVIIRATIEKALDSGADTWAVGELLGWYNRVTPSGCSSSDATAVAGRVLALAARESNPYLLAIDRAKELLDQATAAPPEGQEGSSETGGGSPSD